VIAKEDWKARINRERVVRTLTFWLRPAFVLRVINRFQKVAGFDRAVALASSALTALIPLTILFSALLPHIGGKDTADRLIDRYDLTGGGAEAVRDVFEPTNGTATSISLFSVLLLIIAVLSFTRGVQRMFEQTWELPPLSVRNTLNGLRWIGLLAVYTTLSGWIHALLGTGRLELTATIVISPFTVVFFVLSGWILSAHRIPWRGLVPFAVMGAILLALYSIGAAVYVPHLFSSYASRYGVIGAVFAMISSLFCTMVVVVGSAVAGHEVDAELGRIRRGERPPDDEVRREWDNVIGELRSRWDVAREELNRRRRQRKEAKQRKAAGPAEPSPPEAVGSGADGAETDRSLAPPP
jgi:membrane protein